MQLPWGKLHRDGWREGWLPLEVHSLDVARSLECLVRNEAFARALAAAAGRPLTECDIQRLCALAGYHDIGKVNRGFQARYEPTKVFVGHIRPLASIFTSDDGAAHRVGLALLSTIERWGEAFPYVKALFSHHGRPLGEDILCDFAEAQPTPAARWEPSGDQRPEAWALSLMAVVSRAYPMAFEPGPPLPSSEPFIHLYAGLLMMADWIGSTEGIHSLFAASDVRRSRDDQAYALASESISLLGLGNLREPEESASFEDLIGQPSLRPMQAAMAGRLGQTVVIEDETGGGKTEAAVIRWIALRRLGLVDGLYLAEPTRVAAVEMHGRVKAIVGRYLGPEAAEAVVMAIPGYNDKGGLTPPPAVDATHPDESRDRIRRWASEHPKRFLAARVAVGTVDQALLSIVRSSHAHMRLASLSRSLLVIDEVHASDAYMGVLVERLLRAHRRLGGQSLCMSATLGAGMRGRLLGHQVVPSYQDALDTNYPCISVLDGSGVQTDHVPAGGRNKDIEISMREIIDDPRAIAELALSHARQGARVLVIRNLANEAIAVQRALEEADPEGSHAFRLDGVTAMHHGRYATSDRRRLDAAVSSTFGKESEAAGIVLVGTQTLEVALDIDADVLVTDLAPIDVLLQRFGRLHRHPARERPAGFANARAYVLAPGFDLSDLVESPGWGLGFKLRSTGAQGVYRNLLSVRATRDALAREGSIQVPRDCRRLVEECTHPEALTALKDRLLTESPVWGRHSVELDGAAFAEKAAGAGACYDIGKPFDAWGSDDAKATTRLGAADLRLALPEVTGPFGRPPGFVVVPHWMAPDTPPDAEPSGVEARDGTVTFRLGAIPFAYDRLGLRQAAKEGI